MLDSPVRRRLFSEGTGLSYHLDTGADGDLTRLVTGVEESRASQVTQLNTDELQKRLLDSPLRRRLASEGTDLTCHREVRADGALTIPQKPPDSHVTQEKTDELMMRLLKWRAAPSRPPELVAKAEELYEFLRRSHRQLLQDTDLAQSVAEHQRLVSESFLDREVRIRKEIAVAKDRLVEDHKEQMELRAIFTRHQDQLALVRETNADVHLDCQRRKKMLEAEEGKLRCDLSSVQKEKDQLVKRLQEVKDDCDASEREHARLREKSDHLRERIVLLN